MSATRVARGEGVSLAEARAVLNEPGSLARISNSDGELSPVLAVLFLAGFVAQNASAEENAEKSGESWRVPIFTGVNPQKRDYYEELGRKSDKILDDRSFVEKWRKPGALKTPEQAEEALEEADKALDLVDRAVKNKTAACYYTILVNRCIGEAKGTRDTRRDDGRSNDSS